MNQQASVSVIPIDQIITNPKNSNTHPAAQIERLTLAIKEFGFLVPCVVKTRSDGRYDLAAGHGRIVAAKRAGLTAVPSVIADHLTDIQLRAYVIADNKLAEMSEWDMDILKSELGDLLSQGWEAEVLGFDDEEALKILEGATGDDGSGKDDTPKEEKELKTAIAYSIIFDDDRQQQTWFSFLRFLKTNVDADTIGERLQDFIVNNEYVAEG